jgi:small subunit ribosomal protein S2
MKGLPKFIVVVDPKKESIAVSEAHRMKVPVVAIAGSDNNLYDVDYAIPTNDSSRHTIEYIMSLIVSAYREGASQAKTPEVKAE